MIWFISFPSHSTKVKVEVETEKPKPALAHRGFEEKKVKREEADFSNFNNDNVGSFAEVKDEGQIADVLIDQVKAILA